MNILGEIGNSLFPNLSAMVTLKLHGTVDKPYSFRDGLRKQVGDDELVYSPDLVPSRNAGIAPGIRSYISSTTSAGPRISVEPVSMIACVAEKTWRPLSVIPSSVTCQ